MIDQKVYAFPNVVTPNSPIEFDENACTGCNICVDMCQVDVLIPNPSKGKPPIVLYPDECWQCGCCVQECPCRDNGALRMNWPLMLKMRWKDKETGEHFRFGMANPPPPNSRPPVGGWDAKSKPTRKRNAKGISKK